MRILARAFTNGENGELEEASLVRLTGCARVLDRKMHDAKVLFLMNWLNVHRASDKSAWLYRTNELQMNPPPMKGLGKPPPTLSFIVHVIPRSVRSEAYIRDYLSRRWSFVIKGSSGLSPWQILHNTRIQDAVQDGRHLYIAIARTVN